MEVRLLGLDLEVYTFLVYFYLIGAHKKLLIEVFPLKLSLVIHFPDDLRQEPIRSSPFSSGDFGGNIIIPESPQADSSAMDPRDAVLKPQFRSKTSNKWKGQDQILDER